MMRELPYGALYSERKINSNENKFNMSERKRIYLCLAH